MFFLWQNLATWRFVFQKTEKKFKKVIEGFEGFEGFFNLFEGFFSPFSKFIKKKRLAISRARQNLLGSSLVPALLLKRYNPTRTVAI